MNHCTDMQIVKCIIKQTRRVIQKTLMKYNCLENCAYELALIIFRRSIKLIFADDWNVA